MLSWKFLWLFLAAVMLLGFRLDLLSPLSLSRPLPLPLPLPAPSPIPSLPLSSLKAPRSEHPQAASEVCSITAGTSSQHDLTGGFSCALAVLPCCNRWSASAKCNLTAIPGSTAMAFDELGHTRLVLISCGSECMNEQSLVRGGMDHAYASYPLAERIIAWAIEHTSECAIELLAPSKPRIDCMHCISEATEQ